MKVEKIQDFEQKAIDFISLFEGFKPRAYFDSKGIPLLDMVLTSQRWMCFIRYLMSFFVNLSKDDFENPNNLEFKALVSELKNNLWQGKWKATKPKGDNQKLQNAIQEIIKTHLKEKEFVLTKSQAQEILKNLIPKYSTMLENKLESRIDDKKLSKKIIQELQDSYEYIDKLLSL